MNCTTKCDAESIKKADQSKDELEIFVDATAKNPCTGGIKTFKLDTKPSSLQWEWIMKNDYFAVQDPFAIICHSDTKMVLDADAMQNMIETKSEDLIHFYIPRIKTYAIASKTIEDKVKEVVLLLAIMPF